MSEESIPITVEQEQIVTIAVVEANTLPAAYAYHHVQGISSNTWDIEHNLGFYPNVTTMDSSGSIAEGEIEHLSKYRLRVIFSAPFSGNAYLS
jgi:hypothetical protein